MGPERKGENVLFSVSEAARVLGVSRQAMYQAINLGYLKATDEARGKKIHVQDLLAYGIKTGRDPKQLVENIQEATNAETRQMLGWVLGGLGLLLLITSLFKSDD